MGIRALIGAAGIAAPEALIAVQLGIEVGSWAYPYVSAYFDDPGTLEELQRAARTPAQGYDIHHIVEQNILDQLPTQLGPISREQVDAPSNLVRIPTLKHWELNSWYETPSKDYGGLTPRAYLDDKGWEERERIGLEGLRAVGVLSQ